MAEASAATLPILGALERVAARLKAERNYGRPVEARLLLVIDQFEELFSGAMTDAARTAFVRLIAALARSGRVFVIATLRSSSYGSLAREAELVALKDAGATLDVAVPGPEVLAEIVRRRRRRPDLRLSGAATRASMKFCSRPPAAMPMRCRCSASRCNGCLPAVTASG